MKNKRKLFLSLMSLVLTTLIITSCRKEKTFIPEEQEQLPPQAVSEIKGFYLLNEGNMGSNKASLDYYDFSTGVYRRNIYNQINPEVTLGMGDVGNDIQIYGARMYVVINMSDKVEVLNATTSKRIGQINIPNCRYITFDKGKAFITAYDGYVSVVDTASLREEKRITVGKQPEEMAVFGTKLYVANSGGYNYPNYERTVSVIDLNSLTETKRIDVAINLHHIKADQYGDLYVTSRGDYYDIPSKLFVIDTKTESVKKTFNIAASDIVISKDKAYIYSVEYNYNTGGNTVGYSLLNVKDETLIAGSFITDGTDKEIKIPYGIAVNPLNEDVYVTDAGDYVSPGTLYCFDKNGKKKFSVGTGDIPAHIAFLYK